MTLSQKALDYATIAHSSQKRKDGQPYITHPVSVAKIAEELWWKVWHKFVRSSETAQNIAETITAAALLHDIIEDTDTEYDDLVSEFGRDVADTVYGVTRKQGQNYFEFIRGIVIEDDYYVHIVKIADLEHNMSDLSEGSLKDKYRFAHDMLMMSLRRKYRIVQSNITHKMKHAAIIWLFSSLTTYAIVDTNNNNISDIWEIKYNGELFASNFNMHADYDQDGWNNMLEYIAGTNPFDASHGIPSITLRPHYNNFILSWSSIEGKQYTVFKSTDMLNWYPCRVLIGNYHTTTYYSNEPITNKMFWRVGISDVDSDNDGVTDYEEFLLGLDSTKSQTIAGIPDLWIAKNFFKPLMKGTLLHSIINDTYFNGLNIHEIYQNNIDPNIYNPSYENKWVTLLGDYDVDNTKQRSRQITIPAGKKALVLIVISSDEYPSYTKDASEYNDILKWNIASSNGVIIEDVVSVNSRHAQWDEASARGESIIGLRGPVHIEDVRVIDASEQDIILDISLSITNISDGFYPSTISVGVIPINIVVKEENKDIDNKLVVKKHSYIEVALSPYCFNVENMLEHLITWEMCQKNMDGSYRDWISLGEVRAGTKFKYNAVYAGVYKIRANIKNIGVYDYVLNEDNVIGDIRYGPGLKGDPNHIGVCDYEFQVALCREIQRFYGAVSYSPLVDLPAQYGFPLYESNTLRCNIFVAHRGVAAGLNVPKINGLFNDYPPLANEWAGIEATSVWSSDPTYIKNWTLLPISTLPQPGLIIAHPSTIGPGHCAITDYDGGGLGAGQSGTVNKLYGSFRDGTSRVRMYYNIPN